MPTLVARVRRKPKMFLALLYVVAYLGIGAAMVRRGREMGRTGVDLYLPAVLPTTPLVALLVYAPTMLTLVVEHVLHGESAVA